MRKIITLREESGRKNKTKFKHGIVPILVTALFLLLPIIYAAAAEFTEDTSEISEAFSEERIRPERATVTVVYGGYEYATCNSPIMTVGELLERLDIEVTEKTVVDCELESDITDGLTVTIGLYSTEYYTEETEVAFETVYLPSQTIPKGETRLVSKGKNGINLVTHEITCVDGIAISDKVVSEGVSEAPVDAVYYKGSGGTVTSEDGTVYNYSYYIDVIATAYHTGGITATGHVANEEVVAVDPKVIPYGTKMFITGNWGEIGYRSAEDCGNFKGDRVDICMEGTTAELLQFGRRNMRVYILE